MSVSARRALWRGDQAFADSLFTRVLAGTANGFAFLAHALFRGLLEILPKLHLTENAFALKSLLENAEGLFDIVVADLNLQKIS